MVVVLLRTRVELVEETDELFSSMMALLPLIEAVVEL